MGCGRLFEGDAEQMWASLRRLAALPGETAIYCAHEYAAANARFALSVDDDPRVAERARKIFARRALGEPTVPTTTAEERATNPFLRAPLLRPGLEPAQAFAEIRRLKDGFTG
jgi:hydroxyacylglutathione hydrolase